MLLGRKGVGKRYLDMYDYLYKEIDFSRVPPEI